MEKLPKCEAILLCCVSTLLLVCLFSGYCIALLKDKENKTKQIGWGVILAPHLKILIDGAKVLLA
jgi:hypothetical protein